LVAVRLAFAGRARLVLAGLAGAMVLVLLALTVVRVPAIDRLLLRTDTESSAFSVDSTRTRSDLIIERLERPGYWSLAVGSGMERRSLNASHNTHLEFWVGTGIIGFAGWLVIVGSTLLPGARLARRRGHLSDGEVALLALGAAFVAYVVVAFFAEFAWDRFIWLLVSLIAYLELCRRRGLTPPRVEPDPRSLPRPRSP
jgi:O-antigen ligase